jgi:mannosyltransferase OCH1-like enzyme
MDHKIPPILFQTHREPLENYVLEMIQYKLDNWKYEFYDDNDIIVFFKKNPMQEFPDIINKFHLFSTGQHKADLFRYYYLYINGGFFLDSDAMLYENIENIVKDYDFFSVNSNNVSNSIFQGFIGSTIKNNIIYEALKDVYSIDLNLLKNDYHLICKNLYNIINNSNIDNIKLYDEKIFIQKGIAEIYDKDIIIMIHYWRDKTIPK